MMIDVVYLFVPCVVCGEEHRYLEMIACAWCEEPVCKECYRQDGFCSDEKNADEDWGDDC